MLLVTAFTLAILTPPFAQPNMPAPISLTSGQCNASLQSPFVTSPRFGIGWIEGQLSAPDGRNVGVLIYSPKSGRYYVLPNASMPPSDLAMTPGPTDWIPIATKQRWDATAPEGFNVSSMLPWPDVSVRIGDLGCPHS